MILSERRPFGFFSSLRASISFTMPKASLVVLSPVMRMVYVLAAGAFHGRGKCTCKDKQSFVHKNIGFRVCLLKEKKAPPFVRSTTEGATTN